MTMKIPLPDEQQAAQTEHRADRVGKRRACLRCGTAFESEWAGERICTRCKGSSTWRRGLPLQAFSTGSRR